MTVPSTDLALRPTTTTAPATLDAKIRYAQLMADAGLLPAHYKHNPANVLVAQEFGEALGIPTIQAINSIHVIEGKPSASADLMAALVRRAGHKLRVTKTKTETGGWSVVCEIIRRDDPEFTYRAVWDDDKARKAGLLGKGNWAKYPDQMMRARAISEVCRDGASDALFGVVYTPDELGVETTAEGNPVVTQVPAEDRASERMGAPARIEDAVKADQAWQPPAETGPLEQTDAQRKMLHATIRELKMSREEGLGFIAGVVGHPVESTSDLNRTEASKVIDALKHDAEAAKHTEQHTGEDVVDAELVDSDPGTDHARALQDQAAASWAGTDV
jgi:hypothetical protein